MGQSTFDNLKPGKNIWRLPAGTDLEPYGLRVINDQGNHWAFQPLEDTSPEDYVAGLQLINKAFAATWK